jgi:hypothetical protein
MANPDSANLVKQLWMGGLQETQSAIELSAQEPVVQVASSPVAPAARTLDKFYSADVYGDPQYTRVQPEAKPQWYKHAAFLQSVAVVLVFLLSFILLIAIRPPFLYTKPEDELHKSEFSAARAAWISFGAAAAAAIAMLIIYFVSASKAKAGNK